MGVRKVASDLAKPDLAINYSYRVVNPSISTSRYVRFKTNHMYRSRPIVKCKISENHTLSQQITVVTYIDYKFQLKKLLEIEREIQNINETHRGLTALYMYYSAFLSAGCYHFQCKSSITSYTKNTSGTLEYVITSSYQDS